MARICQLEGCSVDLDEIGKGPRAKYCGGPHRAEASRRKLGPYVRATPVKPRRPPRKPRPSDVRVPFDRIVETLGAELGHRSARAIAERMLTPAQQERLAQTVGPGAP